MKSNLGTTLANLVSLAFLISTCPTSVPLGGDGFIGANANSNGVLSMSQPSDPVVASPKNRKSTLLAIVGLIVIAVLSLGFVAYASLNPQTMTVTQQQFLTNTQNQYVTQVVTSVSTVTNLATVTTAASMYTASTGFGYIGPGYYNCGGYGCSPPSLGAYGSLCQSTSGNNTVQCSGYLSEPTDGCIELAIPYTNPYLLESTAYQWYTLRNVASTLPPGGTWVTVTGQLSQGYTAGTNGAACPGNYINVNSISP
jgi:hypothetical protein